MQPYLLCDCDDKTATLEIQMVNGKTPGKTKSIALAEKVGQKEVSEMEKTSSEMVKCKIQQNQFMKGHLKRFATSDNAISKVMDQRELSQENKRKSSKEKKQFQTNNEQQIINSPIKKKFQNQQESSPTQEQRQNTIKYESNHKNVKQKSFSQNMYDQQNKPAKSINYAKTKEINCDQQFKITDPQTSTRTHEQDMSINFQKQMESQQSYKFIMDQNCYKITTPTFQNIEGNLPLFQYSNQQPSKIILTNKNSKIHHFKGFKRSQTFKFVFSREVSVMYQPNQSHSKDIKLTKMPTLIFNRFKKNMENLKLIQDFSTKSHRNYEQEEPFMTKNKQQITMSCLQQIAILNKKKQIRQNNISSLLQANERILILELKRRKDVDALEHQLAESKRKYEQLQQTIMEKDKKIQDIQHQLAEQIQNISAIKNLNQIYLRQNNNLKSLLKQNNKIVQELRRQLYCNQQSNRDATQQRKANLSLTGIELATKRSINQIKQTQAIFSASPKKTIEQFNSPILTKSFYNQDQTEQNKNSTFSNSNNLFKKTKVAAKETNNINTVQIQHLSSNQTGQKADRISNDLRLQHCRSQGVINHQTMIDMPMEDENNYQIQQIQVKSAAYVGIKKNLVRQKQECQNLVKIVKNGKTKNNQYSILDKRNDRDQNRSLSSLQNSYISSKSLTVRVGFLAKNKRPKQSQHIIVDYLNTSPQQNYNFETSPLPKKVVNSEGNKFGIGIKK